MTMTGWIIGSDNVENVVSAITQLVDATSLRGINKYLFTSHRSLQFHPNSGKYMTLERSNTVARRRESKYDKGVVFTNRPIQLNETVTTRIIHQCFNWKGTLFFGFTNKNPSLFPTSSLTSALELQRQHRDGLCMFGPLTLYENQYVKLTFTLRADGSCWFQINKGELKRFRTQYLSLDQPIWAVFDVYGSVTGIQLLESDLLDIKSKDYIDIPFPELYLLSSEIEPFNRNQRSLFFDDSGLDESTNSTFAQSPRSFSPNNSSFQRVTYPAETGTPIDAVCSYLRNSEWTEDLCVLCCTQERVYAFANCGHYCCCYMCAKRHYTSQIALLGFCRCPLCSEIVSEVVRIYN